MFTFSCKGKSWQFAPGLASSLITLLLLPLFVYLGTWQLDRLKEKKNLEEALFARPQEPALTLADLQQKPLLSTLQFRQLTVRGKFLKSHDILIDNKILQGSIGYFVISPFLLAGNQGIILINRGWVPLGKDRNQMPKINTVEQILTITGVIVPVVNGLLLKADNYTSAPWPLLLQQLDFKKLSERLGKPLFPWLLQLQKESEYSFKLPPLNVGLPSNRHLGYALQWFTIALVTAVYYVGISIKRKL